MTRLLIIPLILLLHFNAFAQTAEGRDSKQPPLLSQKALWFCHILRQKGDSPTIAGLTFKSLKIPVFLIPKDSSVRPLVKLKMQYDRDDWELFIGESQPLKSETPGSLVTYAFLNSRISTIKLTAKNKNGEKQEETVYLFAPEAREYKMVSPFNNLMFTVGAANLIYEQTSFGVFNSKSLLLGTSYISPEKGHRWGFLGDFIISFFTFQSEPLDLNPQFYTGQLSTTYNLKIFKSPRWRSRIIVGAELSGLSSKGSPFGFSNLYGPRLGLRSEFFMSGSESYSFEVYYATYEGLSLDQDRALGLKLSFHNNFADLRQVQYQFTYSNQAFTSDIEQVELDFLSLSTSFSF